MAFTVKFLVLSYLLLIASLFPFGSLASRLIPQPVRLESGSSPDVLSATTQLTRAGVKEEWRLPENIRPVWYSVRLLPFMEEGNFLTEGYVEIFVECINDTNSITLNSAVTIDDSTVSVS